MDKIIKNLKELRKIEPDFEWAVRTKQHLLSQINVTEKERVSFSEKIQILVLRLERKLIPSPVKIVATLLVLSLVGGTTLAAKAAIPGHPLYPIKTKLERVELVFVASPKKEAEIHLKHAKNRVFEIQQLVKKDNPKKEKQINQVVTNLKKDITAAQNSLEVAESEGENVEEVVAVAVQINQGAEEASLTLNQTAESVASEETQNILNEVADVTDAIQDDTTTLIVDKKESGEVSDKVVTSEEVKEFVVKNLERIENKNEIIKKKIDQVETAKVSEVIKQKQEQVAISDLREEEVEKIFAKPEEAKLILEEAKKLIEEDALSEALEKAEVSKEITEETEKVLEKIEEILSNEEGLVEPNNLDKSENNMSSTATTTVLGSSTTTALEIEPIIELGGINNEEDPYLVEEEEPIIEKTPLLTDLDE